MLKIIILAAGQGFRLGETYPKCLLKIGGSSILELTKNKFGLKKSVIIDAGNFFRDKRITFYDLAFKYNYEVYLIRVVCPDENEIKRRLKNRAENYKSSNFNEAATFNIYESTIDIMEDPIDDISSGGEKPNIIEYNSLTNDFKLIQKNNKSSFLYQHQTLINED